MKKTFNPRPQPKQIARTRRRVALAALFIMLCTTIYCLNGNDTDSKRWLSLHGITELIISIR